MNAHSVIYQVALPVPLRRLFDYLPPATANHIQRGSRVKVPFGRQTLVGIVMNVKESSDIPVDQLKPIESLCEDEPLFSKSLCDFFEKTAAYYHHPIGEVAFTGMPSALKQGKVFEPENQHGDVIIHQSELILNDAQKNAVDAILAKQKQFQPFLLEGITGSGKTEVYLQVAQKCIEQHEQVLILVPEISLTPQTQQRFMERFGEAVICFHSRMTPLQRLQAWKKVHAANPLIIVGTRSAIFLPFVQLGLIIIDEEHDPSFKQQDGFRYSARDLAVLRAKMVSCPIVLGSATPSFESLYNAKSEKYQWLHLEKRATSAKLPEVTLLDVRHNQLQAGLSNQLLKQMENCFKQNGQVLLFINRRGFSPTFMCYGCGWMGECPRCDSRLTFHQSKNALICHHCLYHRAKPEKCPDCASTDLNPIGQGTERIESFLQERFAHITMARIDSDATRKKGELEKLLSMAQNKEAQLLIGTQMLAKGHHFPHLNIVAIVDADGGLFSVDFRAIERMAQLLIQVAGRAGRVHEAGKVFIQTFHPEHPLLKHILQQDYRLLAESLLQEREKAHLPPFSHLALIRAWGNQPKLPEALLNELQSTLRKHALAQVSVLGPVPSPMLRRQGQFRYQLLVQANARKPLHQVLANTMHFLEQSKLSKKVRWSLDVDPIEMF